MATKSSKFVSHVIALVRATKKQKRLTVAGAARGVEGRDGRKFYEIRLGRDGVVYCVCPAWRFQKRPPKERECKHMAKCFAEIPVLLAAGQLQGNHEIVIKDLPFWREWAADRAAEYAEVV